MRKLIAVTMVIGAVGAILLAVKMDEQRVACFSCHMGFKVQVEAPLPPPTYLKTVAQQIDEGLIVNGRGVSARRLDPDSEGFRDAFLNEPKRLGH